MAYSRRKMLAIIVMTVLAVISNVYSIQGLVRRIASMKSNSASYDWRMKDLRAMLPPFGVVGYLGDNEDVFASRHERTMYFLTQYALAPVVLDQTPAHRLIVGNFRDEDSGSHAIERNKLIRVRDFGAGLYLLRSGSLQGRADPKD